MSKLIGEPLWEPEATVDIQQGSAELASGSVENDHPVAVLWIPDPEQRHGWREFYVKRATPKPGSKPMGYRKAK